VAPSISTATENFLSGSKLPINLPQARKQGMMATHALTLLFQGKHPDFMQMDKA
jgi:hypothetical protein